MSGRRQHFIPCFLSKRFTALGDRDARLYVHSSNKSWPSTPNNIGYESDFYSNRSDTSTEALDNIITEKERVVDNYISSIMEGTLTQPLGSIAPEIVIHLTIRNAHLRTFMKNSLNSFFSDMLKQFFGKARSKLPLGRTHRNAPDAMQEMITAACAKPPFSEMDVREGLRRKAAFKWLKNLIESAFSNVDFIPADFVVPDTLLDNSRIESDHRSMVRQGLSENIRHELLSKLQWKILRSDSPFILPDCISLALRNDGEWDSFLMAGIEGIDCVVMPLSSSALLLGTASNDSGFRQGKFNGAAASCSTSFFLSQLAEHEALDLPNLRAKINGRNQQMLDKVLNEVLRSTSRTYF